MRCADLERLADQPRRVAAAGAHRPPRSSVRSPVEVVVADVLDELAGSRSTRARTDVVWGRGTLVAALERAHASRRFRAADVRSILEAGVGVPTVVDEGAPLDGDLPVATRSLGAYRLEAL